ncbi:MAG TPA: hypothetical protein VH114_04955 [Candidatus Acidoferrum sp.]|nr:hypothetical protein [Candidatus Acidoferrum sp.]
MKGMSIRQIAKEEGKARETVTKIVHSEEMQQQVKRMREELYGLIPDIIEVLRRAIVSGKLGARLAIELLDRFGIFELCREEILGPAVK